MRVRTGASWALASVVIVGALFTGACNGNKGSEQASAQTSKQAIDAAIVPGADFVARIDIKAIRESPIVKQFEKARKNTVNIGSKTKQEKFQEAIGLSKDDVVAIVISASTDGVDFANGTTSGNLAQLTGVAAIELAKPLGIDKLMAGLKTLLDDGAKAEISKIKIGESEAVRMQSTKPDEPSIYAVTSSDAKTVYLAFNQTNLQAALQREKQGKMVKSPPRLQTISNPTSQTNVAFIAPEGLRETIRQQLEKAKGSPGAAMMEGFIAPFKDLQSIAIGINWDTGMQLEIAGDLGEAQAAAQVSTLLQTMALPMLKRLAAKSAGQMPSNLDDKFKVLAEGTVLRISMSFTGEDLHAYQQAKAGAKTAALSTQK